MPTGDPQSLRDLLWIFGCGRTGSTWLANLLSGNERTHLWYEPMFGLVFGRVQDPSDAFVHSPVFVLGGPAEHRLPPVRAFVLAAVHARYPDLRAGDTLVLKDQNASSGAPLLSEALPESRFVALVRDPRDVYASIRDAYMRPGSWAHRMLGTSPPEEPPFEDWAGGIQSAMDAAVKAYDTHAGPRCLLRYEDLLADTAGELRRLRCELDWPFADDRLDFAIAVNSWQALPEALKGPDEFHRRASPGSWCEDLTPGEIAMVERACSATLERFYGGTAQIVASERS